MFGKLLKYDMKRTMRIGIPLLIIAAVLIVVGVFNGLFQSAMTDVLTTDLFEEDTDINNGYYDETEEELSTFEEVLVAVLGTTIVFSMVISYVIDMGVRILLPVLFTVMFIINLVNFYISLITDEGYLTFTLPVNPVSILSSKYLNATIWNLTIGMVAVGGSFLVQLPTLLYSAISTIKLYEAAGLEISLLDAITSTFGVTGINLYGLLLMVFLLLVMYVFIILTQQSFFFFTIYLGGVIAKKRKLLAGAGFSIAGYYIFYIIEQIIVWIALASCIIPLFFIENISTETVINLVVLILNLVLFVTIIILMIACVGFFMITKWLMTKKLNLP